MNDDTQAPNDAPPTPSPGFELEAPQETAAQEEAPPTPSPGFELEQPTDYTTTGQQIAGGAEALARGAAGFLAPLAEKTLGIATPEEMKGREEALGNVAPALEAAGFLGTTYFTAGLGGAVLKAGEGAMKAGQIAGLLGKTAEVTGLGGRMAAGATKMAAEMAAMQANNEATKYVMDAPNSAGAAAAHILQSAILGGMTGGVFGAAATGLGKLAETTGLKAGIQKWTDRMAALSAGLNDSDVIQHEIGASVDNINNMRYNTWGSEGAKQQAVNKLTDGMSSEALSKATKAAKDIISNAPEEMQNSKVFQKAVSDWEAATTATKDPITKAPINTPAPGEVFSATDNLKRQLGEWSKFDAAKTNIEQQPFIKAAKQMGAELAEHLEDSKMWGKAADLQKGLNAAISDLIPTMKNMKTTFLREIDGKLQVTPEKVATYLREGGKATDESTRKTIMGNFVEKFPKFQQEVDSLYQKAGIDNPHPYVSINGLEESLKKTDPWVKSADDFYHKNLSNLGAETLGTGAGALAGNATGIPGLGYIGATLGGKIGGRILPAILQPMMEKGINMLGFKSAMSYGEAALKGRQNLNLVAKGLFSGGFNFAAAKAAIASREDTEKLDIQVATYIKDPKKFESLTNNLKQYAPEQAAAITTQTAATVKYLSTLKPQPIQGNLLDKKQEPSESAMNAYHRALGIVEKPLSIASYIKDGTLQQQDVKTLQATNPTVYSQMVNALHKEIAERTMKGETVPYQLRQTMSLFSGQALDSTMTPASIQAAQMTHAPAQPPQQPAPKKGGKPSKMTEKGSNAYKTPGQAAEADRSGRD